MLQEGSFNVKLRPYFTSQISLWSFVGKVTSYPALPKYDFSGIDTSTPQQVETKIDLCDVRVWSNVRTHELGLRIPDSVHYGSVLVGRFEHVMLNLRS